MVSRVEAKKGLEQILADRRAAREEIQARGGMDLGTGLQNILAGYNFSSGPRIETTRRRDGTETERIIDGFQLPSSRPDRPEDEDLELNTPYYDSNRGELITYTRSEPTRNRPQGMLKKKVLYKNLKQKERISELVQQGSSLDDIGKAIGIAELAAVVPAAGKAAVKFAPMIARKADDIMSDIMYGDISLSATRGVLPQPTSGVGANVVKRNMAEIKKQADAAREADAKGLLRGSPYERALAKSKSPWQTAERKPIFDKLDSLEAGTEVNIRALAKELNKPQPSISPIIKEYYPDLKILDRWTASKKALAATLPARRAEALETPVDVPTVIKQTGTDRATKGYTDKIFVKWPNDEIKEKYIADFIKRHDVPKGSTKQPITNKYLAKTYLGDDNAKNIATVEKINHELKKQFPNLNYVVSEGRNTIYYSSNVLKNSPFGKQVYGNASKFLKDRMYYTKINRNGEEVKITELHKGHPLQKDFFENPVFPEEFLEAVSRPNFYTTQKRNLDLHKKLENKLIPLINKNDELKLTLHELGVAGKTKTQKFNRTKTEIKKLEDEIDKIADQLNEYGLMVLYPSFGKLKQYGKPYDNLMQLYQNFKIRKSRGEEVFNKGGRVGFVTSKKRFDGQIGGRGEDIETGANSFERYMATLRPLQNEIKQRFESPRAVQVRRRTEKKIEEIRESARANLRNDINVKFKGSELPKLATELLFKPSGKMMTAPMVGGLNAIEYFYNRAREGTVDDIDMKEKFPQVYRLYDYFSSGVGPTPDDQAYIGFVDETIRSIQKGTENLGYSILDLAFTIPDFAFGTNLQEKLKKSYDENAYANPETFLGDVGAILTEFGVPSTAAFKFLNFVKRGLKVTEKSTEGLKGAVKYKTQISNVSKRVATVGGAGFLGEFVGGSRYNTVSRMNPEDPLLFDDTFADISGDEKYRYIDTTGMSGKELILANLTNRIRFGSEGALVGSLFPIVGPALWKATKYGAIKPSAYVAGKGLQAVNYLAIKPASYLLARTPGVAQVGQQAAVLTGAGAKLLGKDVIARAAVSAMGTPTLRQLPDFKDWRLFEVTSTDPLERNLKKFDNFLSIFRDSANQSANRFFITGQTSRQIKATSRKIEKQLDIVEKRAYALAKGFLKDYNSKTTSPAKQDYYLDQVMSYLKGQIKLTDLPEVLQESAGALNKTFVQIKKDFADVLPDGAGLKDFLNSNLRQYIRSSFATFTNPAYRPDKNTFNKAVDFMVDRINKNESMIGAAVAGARVTDQATAIRDFARKQVESMLQRGKADNRDPLDVLNFIARENLKIDDLVVQTGEELPDVIRKLMGEENSLRASVMTTATDLAQQTSNLQMYDKLAKLGIEEGWLFRSADEAIAAGVINPKLVGPRLPGLGKLNSSISETYGGENIVNSIIGSSGFLDGLLKNNIYQGMIAYKAMVQTGKTVYSPATQTRNFGSAGFFPLQSGHIGGAASVQDAFKIMLDDIFGAGKTINEQDLIDRITRKIELGVLDENVVVSELKDVLADLKKANFKSYGSLAERIDNTKISQTATRLYAGGDNVWKWYGHEFVMSQLKNAFKSIDEVKEAYKTMFKADINPTTIEEGVEQYAASLIRDTYPTYSKVPALIRFIRRVPVIGNFVSFPAEILRTTFTTSAIAAKHVASNNPTLRELGYRTLMGQYLTFGAMGSGVSYLGNSLSNMDSQQMADLKEYFVPEFMRFSDLIPVTPMKDGVVKVFDNSRYFPYDLVTSTVGNLMNRMFTQREQLDPDKIETDMLKDLYNYTGPFADLAGGTLLGTAIGYEPALTFLTGGRTKTGSRIYSDTDLPKDKFDKMFSYTFNTINPGFIRTLQNLYKGAGNLLTGTGQPIKMTDEVFKLFGGSSVTIDVPGSFRFKIGELKSSFREPKVAEKFFTPDFRSGDTLAKEYNQQNEEAFREQYEFFKVVRAARRSGFMKDSEIVKLLVDRVGKKTALNIISGRFTPLSYSRDALMGRYQNVKRSNPKDIFSISDYLPLGKLEAVKSKWSIIRFEDYEKEMNKQKDETPGPQSSVIAPSAMTNIAAASAPEPQPLPDTPDPNVQAAAPNVNPQTGLTTTETALLSPGEQAIRQKQRATGVI